MAKADVPKSVWQTYSAFANTIGGLILFGEESRVRFSRFIFIKQ